MPTEDEEYVAVLVRELESNTSVIEKSAIELEKDRGNESELEEIKLALHSLKGLFGFLDQSFSHLRIITHQLEDQVIENGSEVIDLLLKYCDENRILIDRLRSSATTNIDSSDLYIDLKAKLSPEISLDQKYRVTITFVKTSKMKTARMLSLINKLKRISTIESTTPNMDELFEIDDFNEGIIELVTREPKQSLQDAITRVPELHSYSIIEVDIEQQVMEGKEKITTSTKIEVDTKQIDQIIEMVEEFLMVGNIIEKLDKSSLSSADINILSSFNQKVIEMQDIIFSLKQLPAEIVLKPIPRLVRDLAKDLGKNVSVYTLGGNTGVDRPVIEVMSDILVILVQNALVHGIESAEEREKLGKPQNGILRISVSQEEGYIIFEVSDDGRGLNYKELWDTGIENGLIDKHEVFDQDVARDLIFLSGFSMTATANMTSGRGVGLSSVAKDIKNIGGTVSVNSELGKGTSFIIRIPSIKPIIPVIVTTIGQYDFGFPQTGVYSIERLKPKMKSLMVEESLLNEREFLLEIGDSKIRTINLINIFSRGSFSSEQLSLIHWKFDGSEYSFLVNDINGITDLAVNYEDPFVSKIPYLSGTSVIEADHMLLILKPSALI